MEVIVQKSGGRMDGSEQKPVKGLLTAIKNAFTVNIRKPRVRILVLLEVVRLLNCLVFERPLKSERFGSDFKRSVG